LSPLPPRQRCRVDRFSYPFNPTGFIAAELANSVNHVLLAAGAHLQRPPHAHLERPGTVHTSLRRCRSRLGVRIELVVADGNGLLGKELHRRQVAAVREALQ
jgi:hypothetical protein